MLGGQHTQKAIGDSIHGTKDTLRKMEHTDARWASYTKQGGEYASKQGRRRIIYIESKRKQRWNAQWIQSGKQRTRRSGLSYPPSDR